MSYAVSSIESLMDEEAAERSWYAKVHRLQDQYPFVTKKVIERLLMAADLSGAEIGLVVRRYLDGDKSVDVGEAFREAYVELVIGQA